MKNPARFAIVALALAPFGGFAQTLAPSADTYYVPGNGTNFGTGITITVGSSSSVGLVQFDLTQLPAGVSAAQIQKATLTLFLDHVNSAGTINVDTVSAATPWGELTVNGNSGISPGSAVATGISTGTPDTFISMDATAAVQGWITTPGSNNGFMILANGTTSVQFDSKENTTTSHPATLTIILASSGPAGAVGATGATGATGAASTVPGPTGPSGPAGPTGAASTVAGPSGPTGPSGPVGVAGPSGPSGPLGPNGAVGPSGPSGPLGANGAVGPSGPIGAAGPSGPSGPLGANGAVGPSGPVGAAGPSGPSGPLGANGAVGPSGPAGPSGAAGSPGPAGPSGPAGAVGPSGPAGLSGSNGAAGATGPSGPAGSNGTGASPTGIPLRIGGNTGAATWNTPGGNEQQATLNALTATVAPVSCTPSMTVRSYAGAAITWTLISVNPSTTSNTWTPGSTIISCGTSAAAGNSCTQTGSADQVAAGTIMVLTTSTQTAPSGGGFLSAFSCLH